MSGQSFPQLAKRALRATYTRLPLGVRSQIEKIISPITFRLFVRNSIVLNTELGMPPFRPVSIVIPSYNDVHLLVPLIKSLKQTLRAFEYEIIISDDYCQIENSMKLEGLKEPRVKVIFTENRTGFAGAVNRGILESQFDVILLNSDIIALDYWLENLQSAAYNFDSKIGLVSPHLLYPTGRIQYGGTFHASVSAPQWFGHLDQGRIAKDKKANVGKYVAAISGACVYIKRELLDQLHGLDEGYWLGFEDVDLAFAAKQLGYRSYLEPSSKLVHLESASRGKVQGFKEYASLRRFWDKWHKAVPDNNSPTQVDLFISEKAPTSLRYLSHRITQLLTRDGVIVTQNLVNSISRVDESIVQLMSPRNSYKVAMDKQSVETVWLSSEMCGVPVIYFPSLDEATIDISSPKDLALFKPEFTFVFGNPVDSGLVDSCIPWTVEKYLTSPSYTQITKTKIDLPPLSAPLVRLISRQPGFKSKLGVELTDSGITVVSSTESELLSLLSAKDPRLHNEIVVFEDQFTNTSLPLTLLSQGILFLSIFSETTKFYILDGYNTFCYQKGDHSRAKVLIENLIADVQAQQSIRENGDTTVRTIDDNFTRAFMAATQGRNNEILPIRET